MKIIKIIYYSQIFIFGILCFNIYANASIKSIDYTSLDEVILSIPIDFNYKGEHQGEYYTDITANNLLEKLSLVNKAEHCDDSLLENDTNSCSYWDKQINQWTEAINSAILDLKYKPADYTKTNEALIKALLINRELYTIDSLNVLDNAVMKVESGKSIKEQNIVDNYTLEINNALDSLIYIEANYVDLLNYLEQIKSINRDNYTTDSLLKLDKIINSIDYTLKINEQAKVDNYLLLLKKTYNKLTLKEIEYKFNEQEYKFENDSIIMIINGPYEMFDNLYINDELVNKKYYSIEQDNTKISLSKEYLERLSNGTYDIKAVYKNNSKATSKLIIQQEEIINPNTYDRIYKYYAIFIMSIIILIVTYKIKKETV